LKAKRIVPVRHSSEIAHSPLGDPILSFSDAPAIALTILVRGGLTAARRSLFLMKISKIQITRHAKFKACFALCTVMAFTAATAFADDDKEKDKGAPPADGSTATGKSSQLSRTDERFIKEAAKGGQMEVQMGKLGLKNAQSTEVKQFSQRLIDDHTKANTELKQLAASKGLTLPDSDKIAGTEKDSDRTRVREGADTSHDKELHKLDGLSGAEFDRAFAKMAVADHEKDIKEFEKASQNAEDAEVKAFAAKTLPVLR